MFCGKCGAKNEDSAIFCAECGSLMAAQPTAPAATETPATGSKPGFTLNNRNIGIIAVAAVAALALIIGCFFIFGGKSGPEGVVDTMISAINKGSAKEMLKLLPDELTEKAAAFGGDFTDMIQESMDEMQEDLEDEFGKGWKASYKILSKEKLDKEELEDLNDTYSMLDIKVKEAYVLEVELTVKGKNDKEVDTTELCVIKVGSKWYLDFMSMSLF
jgi:hypothetical protein